MAGIVDKLQEVLTAVARLADVEKRIGTTAKESREELLHLTERVSDLHRKIEVLEARFNALRGEVIAEARAAAQSAAALAVGEQFAQIRERLVVIERRPPAALPPP